MISILILLGLLLAGTDALTVTIPLAAYEVARGNNITVPCSFQSLPDTSKLVMMQWSSIANEVGADDDVVIVYYPPDIIEVGNLYTGRAAVDMDVTSRKFNLKLSFTTLNDNRRFKCHVQARSDTTPSSAFTTVVVLVPPTPPVCNIQGKAEYGQNINLTCASREGSPLPTYKWQSLDTQNKPRPFDPKTTDQGGILSLYNISKDASGFFICTSTNKMGSATCNLTLAVMPPSMNIGSTAGIVAGVAIALLLFAIIIYCCCCRKKNKEEEYAMGVHEDEYHDKEPVKNADGRHADGQEEVRTSENTYVKSAPDAYEERSERGKNRDYDDRRSDYDDRRSDYDDRRSDYNDRRSDYDDRRSDYSDRRDKYSDRNERYDDNRRSDDNRRDDRKDRRYDDDRYDEPYDDRNRDRPQVPNNKPPRRNYDD